MTTTVKNHNRALPFAIITALVFMCTSSHALAQLSRLVSVYHSAPTVSCTNPNALVAEGALYSNTCTASGVGPFSFGVGLLPSGLSASHTDTSVTVSGSLHSGNYSYGIQYSGGGDPFANVIGGYAVTVVPRSNPAGTTTIRCLKRPGANSMCQVCAIASGVRTCDFDDDFNKTNNHPEVPTAAVVSSVYLNSEPFTWNVDGYTLDVIYKSPKANLVSELAHKFSSGSAVIKTKLSPDDDLNSQIVSGTGTPWNFNFSPSVADINNSEWGLDFQCDIDWITPPATLGNQSFAGVPVPHNTTGLREDVGGILFKPGALPIVAVANLEGPSTSEVLAQDTLFGKISAWSSASNGSYTRTDLTATPGMGWRLSGVADIDGDGSQELIFQDNFVGLIKIWRMSGLKMISETAVTTIPVLGQRVVGAISATKEQPGEIVLQNTRTRAITLWDMSNLQVSSQTGLDVVPPVGTTVVAIADITGDHRGNILLQDGLGKLMSWPIADHRVAGQVAIQPEHMPSGFKVMTVGRLMPGQPFAALILQGVGNTGAFALYSQLLSQ